jgi:hypothetical protein
VSDHVSVAHFIDFLRGSRAISANTLLDSTSMDCAAMRGLKCGDSPLFIADADCVIDA